jgi:hypothetical protein
MRFHFGIFLTLIAAASAMRATEVRADDRQAYGGSICAASAGTFFQDEVWPKVGARSCLECHKAGGDAEDSDFVLLDPARNVGAAQEDALRQNRERFAQMARTMVGERSRLLLKATGKLKHGGKEVVKPDSAGYRVLAEFVRRSSGPTTSPTPADLARSGAAAEQDARPFFDGVVMLDDPRLLRRDHDRGRVLRPPSRGVQ